MPLGKSGKHYYSPHEMGRQGDSPDDSMHDSRPDQQEQEGQGDEGDGNQHHEIELHDDGTAHSTHTHPDGQKEEFDHGSYGEAKDHMDSMMGSEDDGDADDMTEEEPRMESGNDDLAGMYSPGK